MNILRRGVPAAKAANRKNIATTSVSRRIEVTVERETVTMLVRGQPQDSNHTIAGNDKPKSEFLELPPSAPASEKEE